MSLKPRKLNFMELKRKKKKNLQKTKKKSNKQTTMKMQKNFNFSSKLPIVVLCWMYSGYKEKWKSVILHKKTPGLLPS